MLEIAYSEDRKWGKKGKQLRKLMGVVRHNEEERCSPYGDSK